MGGSANAALHQALDAFADLASEQHLAHLPDRVLDEYAEEAE